VFKYGDDPGPAKMALCVLLDGAGLVSVGMTVGVFTFQGAAVKASQCERPRSEPVHTSRSLQPRPRSVENPFTLASSRSG